MNAREYRAILSALDHALEIFDRQIACTDTERQARDNLAQVRSRVAQRADELDSELDARPGAAGG